MISYLILNTLISLCILAIIRYAKGSSRANYLLSSFGLLIWCLPTPLISQILPQSMWIEPVLLSRSATELTQLSRLNSTEHFFMDGIHHVALMIFSLGLLIFSKELIRFNKFKSEILLDPTLKFKDALSHNYGVQLYTSAKVENGILLGLFNPKVIISDSIEDISIQKLIILHEKQHLIRGDNQKLFILELIRCLFWWNPIVSALVNTNRFFIETLCDEQASTQCGKDNYVQGLATLILHNQKKVPSTLASSAISEQNNMDRLKRLKEPPQMTHKNRVIYLVASLTAIAALSWNTVSIADTPNQVNRHSNDETSSVSQQEGALIHYDIWVSNDQTGNEFRTQLAMWIHFDEPASFQIAETLELAFQISDLGNNVELKAEISEIGNTKQLAFSPKLITPFAQEAAIEVANNDTTYRLTAFIEKTALPE